MQTKNIEFDNYFAGKIKRKFRIHMNNEVNVIITTNFFASHTLYSILKCRNAGKFGDEKYYLGVSNSTYIFKQKKVI